MSEHGDNATFISNDGVGLLCKPNANGTVASLSPIGDDLKAYRPCLV